MAAEKPSDPVGGAIAVLAALTSPAKLAFGAYILLVYADKLPRPSPVVFGVIIVAFILAQVFHDDYVRKILNNLADQQIPPIANEQVEQLRLANWNWKRIRKIGIIVSIAASLAFLVTWYFCRPTSVRPKTWASTQLTASFQDAEQSETFDKNLNPLNSGNFELHYVLVNHTDTDYNLRDRPIIMTKQSSGYKAVSGLSLQLPVFVPAGHSVIVSLNAPYDAFDQATAGHADASTKVVPGLNAQASQVFHSTFANVSAFAIFDSSARYRIDLQRP